MREFLPLLAQERWYPRTRRGYARGWEPVRYVDNVQAYLNILAVAGVGSAPPGETAAAAPQEKPAPVLRKPRPAPKKPAPGPLTMRGPPVNAEREKSS